MAAASTTGAGGNPEAQENTLGQKIDDLQSYPILTEEISFPTAPPSTAPAAPGVTPLSHLVERALRDVLGWRPKADDPKGFVAALNQSFALKERQGRTEWAWMPRTYAVQADLGAVTGAQASIYARAKAALEQSLPLLDGLKPLRADADAEDVDAARAIVRSALLELVAELGVEGGPRVERVDAYFADLLGELQGLTDPLQVKGQLGLLRDEFGLAREQVNTVAEEHTLTDFLILVEHILALKQSWDFQRESFLHNGHDVFLGTQLVVLSRALAVVAESVQETYFAMNSVFLGPAERQVTTLHLKGHPPIFVGELLGWVERFASEEGPRLIREGGKDGVIRAFTPTVDKLRRLVRAASALKMTSTNPTRGFHTPRVQRALQELADHLDTTFALADRIKRLPRPEMKSVRPHHGRMGDEVDVDIGGANFQEGATAHLAWPNSEVEIPGKDVVVVGTTLIKATFRLSQEKVTGRLGAWSVVVTNPDGQYDWKVRAFTVEPPPSPPTPTSVTPSRAPNTGPATLTLGGQHFQPKPTARLTRSGQPDIVGEVVSVSPDGTTLQATFDLTAKQPGPWTVVVATEAGSGELPDRFTIVSPSTDVEAGARRRQAEQK
jgi:hypothetical protein